MFAKCRYLDEITGGRGVVFATGTPVSNSMVELYTMMRYLQYDLLKSSGLEHFDSWAANFGEAITALEAGCDVIKLFPGNILGPAAISSFKGPLPQGEFMPSGGVDVDNVDKWIKAGAYAVGTGSSLTKGAKTGDFAAVTAKAKEFAEAVKAARK